ncbi:MAG: hypothetical protein LH615_02440 [Ferruginibacter sp.]|nr:hypothetical protein [Ferruginibacter sp.]
MKTETNSEGNNKEAAQTQGNNAANNISPLDIKLLDTAGEDDEERNLHNAELDNTDDDGELLNENTSGDITSGSELDVPGSEEETTGEEDEENNSYSLSAEKED